MHPTSTSYPTASASRKKKTFKSNRKPMFYYHMNSQGLRQTVLKAVALSANKTAVFRYENL